MEETEEEMLAEYIRLRGIWRDATSSSSFDGVSMTTDLSVVKQSMDELAEKLGIKKPARYCRTIDLSKR